MGQSKLVTGNIPMRFSQGFFILLAAAFAGGCATSSRLSSDFSGNPVSAGWKSETFSEKGAECRWAGSENGAVDPHLLSRQGQWTSPQIALASSASGYRISFRFKATEPGKWSCTFFNEDGEKLPGAQSGTIQRSTLWSKETVTVDIPEDATHMRVMFSSLEDGIVSIDDVSVHPVKRRKHRESIAQSTSHM